MNTSGRERDSSSEPIRFPTEEIEMKAQQTTFEERVKTLDPNPKPIEPIPIDQNRYKLPPLFYKPFFLRTWVLTGTILLNLGWIPWLVYVYTCVSISGSNFILGGLFAGYVASVAKFFITAQIMSMGKIIPYKNMVSATEANVQNTIDSDYWPYEWPILRFRAFRNGDYFFQFVDIVAFLFTYAVVQFESNILRQSPDADNSYTPNHGVVIIVIICHGVVVVTHSGHFDMAPGGGDRALG
jgi:hypothetical protein